MTAQSKTSSSNGKTDTYRSEAPIFADLFYAAVIGFAVSQLSYDKPKDLLYLFVVFLFVLEDWFAYYRVVKPVIVDSKAYTFYALIVEFLILASWSLAYGAVKHQDESSFIYLAVFMGVRWFAGIRHWIQKRQTLSIPFLMESLYGLIAITGVLLYLTGSACMTYPLRFTIFTSAWVICISLWWILRLRVQRS